MYKKINTFIFDCFGVILDPLVMGWYKENRLKYGFVDDNISSFLKEVDLGNASEDDIVDYFMKYDGVNLTKEEMREDIDSHLKLDNNLANIIKKLKEKGFKTVLLSNANASVFERKIYKTYPEFKNLFDDIIISSNIKMIKPNPDIYLYALEKINLKAKESLFIDDSQKNVDGALNVGMQGFLYTDVDSFAEYISSLGINLND
ncbi:HAD family phosphatase [Candidatus Nomurabacteria bacterium]|nr:HAD family phosphatase [Candidatus Nomurabacteria bacterium]